MMTPEEREKHIDRFIEDLREQMKKADRYETGIAYGYTTFAYLNNIAEYNGTMTYTIQINGGCTRDER